MAQAVTEVQLGEGMTQEHSCYDCGAVIKCDGETDKMKCRVCGKEWTESCNFDDDYS